MASATPTSLPGVSAPLEHISSHDQGGLIVVMAAMAWTFALVAFGIRVYVRYKTGPWKLDDSILTAATMFFCVQSILVFSQCHQGLGNRDLKDSSLVSVQKAGFASDIFYVLILWLSKCSVAFLYLRLTPAKHHFLAIWSIIAGTTVWALMSIMLISIRCHVGNPWATWSTECTNFFARWEVISSIDIITEVALFAMSIYLVWALQMSSKAKTVVVAAFGARLAVIPAAAIRLYYLNPDTLPSNRTLASSLVVVCSQLELGYGLLAATIPVLKPFVAVYEGPAVPGSTYGRSYGQTSDPEYNLKSFNSTTSTHQPLGSRDGTETQAFNAQNSARGNKPRGPSRPEQTKYTASATAAPVKPDDKNNVGSGRGRNFGHGVRSSDDSRQMIIETKTGWSVEYDQNSAKDETSVIEREVSVSAER